MDKIKKCYRLLTPAPEPVPLLTGRLFASPRKNFFKGGASDTIAIAEKI